MVSGRAPHARTKGARALGESSDAEGGDPHQGYAISLRPGDGIMRVRLWGLWTYEVSGEFRAAILRLGARLTPPWSALCDSRAFPTQGPAVTRLRARTMDDLADIGCVRIAAVVQTAVYAMQFQRIAGQSRLAHAVFDDEESASRWLRERSLATK